MERKDKTTGTVTGIIANLVIVEVNGPVAQNEICFITLRDEKLMAEVIKLVGKNAYTSVLRTAGRRLGLLALSPPLGKDRNRLRDAVVRTNSY